MGNANDADTLSFMDPPISTLKYPTEDYDKRSLWYKEALNNLKTKNQIAIVGFWRMNPADAEKEYYCYHYFYVPNPCVREYKRSEHGSYIHEGEDKTTASVS